MSFVTPALLLGLLAVGVPIAVHLIHRRKAARVRFAAIELLRQSDKRLARAMKLKRWMLLALRIAVFALLPLAMAQPYLDCGAPTTATAADARLPASVVLVVDDSASVSLPGGDGFEAVRDAAIDAVRDLRSWDRIAVLFSGGEVLWATDDLVEDHGTAIAALRDHTPRWGAGDVPAALRAAGELHEQARMPVRRTIVIGDDAASDWQGTAPDAVAGLGPLERIPVAVSDANLALTDARWEEVEAGYRLSATVAAFGAAEGRAEVTVEVDGAPVGAAVVDVAAGGTADASVVHRFDDDGVHEVTFRVEDGVGPEVDDVRHLVVHLESGLRVGLVDGDARSVAYNDELYFIERALDALSANGRAIDAVRVTPDGVDTLALDALDVVVLANVATLPATEVRRLRAFVEAGGGLWITAGDNVDPDRYNALFGALLPRPIRSVKVLAEPGARDADVLATRIATLDTTHPVFRVFSLPGGETMQSVIAYRYVLLEPQPGETVRTVASFGDGGPALLEHEVGRGRVALWTTSIDDDWTDLPIRTAFVPFVQRVLEYVARRGASAGLVAPLGEPIALDVEPWDPERVHVEAPDGMREVLEPVDARVVVSPATRGPHRVSLELDGVEAREPSLDFVAVAPSSEASVDRLTDEGWASWQTAAAAGADVGAGEAAYEGRQTIWPALLFALLVAIYLETVVSVRRRVWARMRA